MILVIAKCTIPEECNNFLEKYLYIVCVYYQYRVSVCLSACMCMVLCIISLYFSVPLLTQSYNKQTHFKKCTRKALFQVVLFHLSLNNETKLCLDQALKVELGGTRLL